MAYHLPSKEDYGKINNIMTYLKGKESHNHDASIITDLFNAHNLAFPQNPEYSKSCGGCRVRVYNRLTTYSNETKQQYGY